MKICSFCLLAFVANSNLLIHTHGQGLYNSLLMLPPPLSPLIISTCARVFSFVPLALLSVFNSQIRHDSFGRGFQLRFVFYFLHTASCIARIS